VVHVSFTYRDRAVPSLDFDRSTGTGIVRWSRNRETRRVGSPQARFGTGQILIARPMPTIPRVGNNRMEAVSLNRTRNPATSASPATDRVHISQSLGRQVNSCGLTQHKRASPNQRGITTFFSALGQDLAATRSHIAPLGYLQTGDYLASCLLTNRKSILPMAISAWGFGVGSRSSR